MTSRSRFIGLLVLVLLAPASLLHAQKRHLTGHKPASAAPAPAPPANEADSTVEPASAPVAQAADTAASAKPEAVPASPATSNEQKPEPPRQDSAQPDPEVTGLQQELAQVMDDLVQARARVALLGKSLFKTRVRVKLDNRAAPDQVAVRIALFLDGAPIWSGDGAGVRDARQILFDGVAAPGPHVLGLEIEQRAREDDAYRYTLRNNYHFSVLRERRTDLTLMLDDDSDIADDFKDDDEGQYDVRTKLEVRAVGLNEE